MAKIIKLTPAQFAKTQAQRYDNLAASFERLDQQFPGQGYDQLALQKRLQAADQRSKTSQNTTPLPATGSVGVFSSLDSGTGGTGNGTGGGTSSSSSSDSCGGGQRKIPCPFCTGQILATQNGKGSSSQTLFPRLQNFLTAVSDLISVLTMGQKTVSRRKALGGKCETCGNSGSIKDPTDRKSQERAAAQILKSNASKIRELETKLGHSPGGSMLERIAGAKVTIVGRTLNNAKSVTVLKGKAAYPESQVVKKDAGPTTKGPKKGEGTNQIVGNNPPANTGGGVYYIQCGNKFKMTTGAQGIEMMSYGPINIDGTQVRISGAEVTLGTNGGPTVVEGDHLQLNGKSIALTPSGNAGEVVIQGSASCSGNFKTGGAYVENLYAASITCPSSQTSTKVAAGTTDYVTGPAKWGGTNSSFPKLAVQNLLKWVTDSTTDFNLLGGMPPINPRSILKTTDNMSNMVYAMQTLESNITGIAIGTMGISLVYNFPHSHALPDSAHSHDVTVPAISHDGNSSAEVVRQKFDATGGNSKMPAGPTESGNPLVKLVGGVIGGITAVAGAFSALVNPYSD